MGLSRGAIGDSVRELQYFLGRFGYLQTAPDDPFASPHTAEWQHLLPQAQLASVPGGMVPMPDQLPQAFAQVVLDFLEGLA